MSKLVVLHASNDGDELLIRPEHVAAVRQKTGDEYTKIHLVSGEVFMVEESRETARDIIEGRVAKVTYAGPSE